MWRRFTSSYQSSFFTTLPLPVHPRWYQTSPHLVLRYFRLDSVVGLSWPYICRLHFYLISFSKSLGFSILLIVSVWHDYKPQWKHEERKPPKSLLSEHNIWLHFPDFSSHICFQCFCVRARVCVCVRACTRVCVHIGASLVAQWERICLPTQETWI